jgi:hypothetical protein
MKITGTIHDDRYTFLAIFCSDLLRITSGSDKSCRENRNAHFLFSIFFLNPAIDEIILQNMVQLNRSQLTVRCMYIAWWIPNATKTHSQSVTHIAFLHYIGYTMHLTVT